MAEKIYVVEDDENIRELVIYALSGAGFDALGFECGADFFEEIRNELPKLVLLDIMLPKDDGMSILRKIKEDTDTQNVSVIMLTAKSSELDKVRGLDLGADDYMTKPFSVLELLSRVRAVLRRAGTQSMGDVLQYSGIVLDTQKHTVSSGGKPVVLTFKEFELLEYLLQNTGIVLTREKLIKHIWGYDFEGESRTVDMHIKTLRQKLGACAEHITTIRGVGYKIGG